MIKLGILRSRNENPASRGIGVLHGVISLILGAVVSILIPQNLLTTLTDTVSNILAYSVAIGLFLFYFSIKKRLERATGPGVPRHALLLFFTISIAALYWYPVRGLFEEPLWVWTNIFSYGFMALLVIQMVGEFRVFFVLSNKVSRDMASTVGAWGGHKKVLKASHNKRTNRDDAPDNFEQLTNQIKRLEGRERNIVKGELASLQKMSDAINQFKKVINNQKALEFEQINEIKVKLTTFLNPILRMAETDFQLMRSERNLIHGTAADSTLVEEKLQLLNDEIIRVKRIQTRLKAAAFACKNG